jgi:Lon protease-like protein
VADGVADEAVAWRICAAAPVGSFDRQAILAAPSWSDRLEQVARLSDDVAADAAALLAGPPGPTGPDPGPLDGS